MTADLTTDRQFVDAVTATLGETSAHDLDTLHDQLAERADRDGLLDIAYRIVDSPYGQLLIAATPTGLLRVAFEREDHDAVLSTLSRAVSPRILRTHRRTDPVARQLDEYFSGERRFFDVALDLRLVGGFRRTVIAQLPDIAYGSTATYASVAAAAGNPKAVRAVGSACANNPLPVVVPCHRVVRSDGSVGQYLGGAAAKVALLAMEAAGMIAGNAPTRSSLPVDDRVDRLDWRAVAGALDAAGVAAAGSVLSAAECEMLIELYGETTRFRSTIDMARHRFGEGQYRYFANPLPELVTELRAAFWPHLLPIARDWAARRNQPVPWPDTFDDWLSRCHDAGQTRPTPLMLRYGPGDWNALHRDLYGELVFPLQVVIGLNEPDADYTGGEFVVVEQRPRAQSRATCSTVPIGHALVFTTRDRPVASTRGWANAPMRHGVSTVRSGIRHTLGLVFHDAT